MAHAQIFIERPGIYSFFKKVTGQMPAASSKIFSSDYFQGFCSVCFEIYKCFKNIYFMECLSVNAC